MTIPGQYTYLLGHESPNLFKIECQIILKDQQKSCKDLIIAPNTSKWHATKYHVEYTITYKTVLVPKHKALF